MARPGDKLLPSLGILLVTGGLLLLGWIGYLWLNPGPPPYQYRLAEEGNAASAPFESLGLQAWPDLTLKKYEVRVADVNEPVALAYTGSRAGGPPILLNWESRSSELLIGIDNKPAELAAVAGAIAKYAPKDALILSWWDTSRQIGLLSGRDTLFAAHVGEPLIVPPHWNARSDTIRQYEEEFWGAPAPTEERQKFQRFADALVADAHEGAKMLRDLAGTREAYLVLHVTDLYKLGLMRPDRFEVAYKDFPMSGSNMHGLINHMKTWMQQNNYKTYTLQSLSDQAVRGYFLREGRNSHTLLAQALPFTDTQPLDLKVVELIYQQGAYWVYKIPAEIPPAASAHTPLESTPEHAPAAEAAGG